MNVSESWMRLGVVYDQVGFGKCSTPVGNAESCSLGGVTC